MTILKNIDIDIDMDKAVLENIAIDKNIFENINIDIDIVKDILENIDIDIDLFCFFRLICILFSG